MAIWYVPPLPGSSHVDVWPPDEQKPLPDVPLSVNVRNTPAGNGCDTEADVTVAVTAMLSTHGGTTHVPSASNS